MTPRVNVKVKKIYSANNDFQYADTLRRNRQRRTKHQEFFVEGVRPITQALAHGWKITTFLYSPDKRLSQWAQDTLARSEAETHLELPLSLMAALSNKEEPSELIALVAMPPDDLARLPQRDRMCIVVMDRPTNPGNLGSIIRSCDALQADGLVIVGHAADVYDPETISASTGSLFALPIVRVPSPELLVPWIATIRQKLSALQIVGSDESGTVDVNAHDWTPPTLLVVGNEARGMSARFREMCDTIIRIPIYGSASSLNVACATSIILYERDRQRRQELPIDADEN